ncbi:MAG: hypothetical protein ACI974_000196, partial [Paraglaciecola sp.]
QYGRFKINGGCLAEGTVVKRHEVTYLVR